MADANSYLDINLLRKLLDIYYDQTSLPIAFYSAQNEEKPVYSRKNWPNFCIRANELIGKTTCQIDKIRLGKKGLFQCNAGLWCYSHPLIIDGILLGTFIFGHKPIKGRDQETVNKLNETLRQLSITQDEKYILFDILNKEIPIEKESFLDDIKLLERLSFIETYIALEHLRSTKEHEKIMTFKNEYESLANEFLIPIQSIVAEADNLITMAFESKKYDIKNTAEDILQETIKLSYIAEKIQGSVLMEKNSKSPLNFELVDIYEIISETADLFRKEARKKNVTIQIRLTSRFKQFRNRKCEVSKSHIKQVFFNLIHNAVKYSFSSNVFSDRYIVIKCDAKDNMFFCSVSNFGIGILPEELEKIFEKGYRGKLSLDRSRIGSGFGLFKVKEIINLHKGIIEVESKKVGVGPKTDPFVTTFRVGIPFHQKTYMKFYE